MRIWVKLIRVVGLLVSVTLSSFVIVSKFVKQQPARVKLSILGVILLLGLLFILVRFGKLWIQKKLSAIATANELGINGRTKPLSQVILSMFYIFYPSLVLVLFLYGMAVYKGTLWLDCLILIGCIAIYFIFEIIALWYERYLNKLEELKRLNQEKEDIAERVSKKIKFEIKK